MVSFDADEDSRTFTFFYDEGDLIPSGDNFREYRITVAAVYGNAQQLSTDGSFVLRVKNPCRDNDYCSIIAPSVPEQLDDYNLNSGQEGTIIATIPQF